MIAAARTVLTRLTGREISKRCHFSMTFGFNVVDSEVNDPEEKTPTKLFDLEEIAQKTKNLKIGQCNGKINHSNPVVDYPEPSDFNDDFISPEEAFKILQTCRTNDVDNEIIPKRQEHVTWDEFFMGIALMAAQRSKDPNTQVGAVIVNSKNVICGVGYNGFPNHCSDDEFCWSKGKNPLLNKNSYVLHAEQNAILNCTLKSEIEGTRIYTTLFPCFKCTQMLIQTGVKEIIYQKYKIDNEESIAAKAMIYKAGIKTRLFKSERKSITLYF